MDSSGTMIVPTSSQASRPPPPGIPGRPRIARWLLLGPALLSALLLYGSYFPLNWGWLAWAALVPFLCLVRSQAGRRVYFYGWFSGLAFYFPALQWLRVADWRMYGTWFALAVYCSLYFPAALALLRRLDRRTCLPLTLSLPAVWTGLELLRTHLMGGFAWYFLSHTQHNFPPIIQIADVTGAYGLTFLIAAVNALVFEILASFPALRTRLSLRARGALPSRRGMLAQAAVIAMLSAAAAGYGAWRLAQDAGPPGPLVSLIQGNMDQRLRNTAAGDSNDEEAIRRAQSRIEQHYDALSRTAAGHRPRPDLVVWPETSLPFFWRELAEGFPVAELDPRLQEVQKGLQQPGRRWQDAILPWLNGPARAQAQRAGTHVLLGLNTLLFEGAKRERRYNSAVLLDANGRLVGRYDKIHRVPFGEYVPLRELLPWMNALAPYDYDYSIRAGEHARRFPLGPWQFGVLICYEDTDPDLARRYCRPERGEPAVDFLINMSNDGWFDGTSEHDEHLAIARFRAVECRRSLARAVNMGISAVVDGNGRVLALPGVSWAASKKVAAVLTAAVPIDRRTSLYCLLGDWLPWSCAVVTLIGLALSLRPARDDGPGTR